MILLPLLRSVLGDGTVNERDSLSWKWSVGKVSPLIRLIAIEPSTVN